VRSADEDLYLLLNSAAWELKHEAERTILAKSSDQAGRRK